MIPREKAAQLVVNNQLKVKSLDYNEAVQCALIAVDEILHALEYKHTHNHEELCFYEEVKQEIENR